MWTSPKKGVQTLVNTDKIYCGQVGFFSVDNVVDKMWKSGITLLSGFVSDCINFV